MLRREGGHILRALDLEAEGQRMTKRVKRTWKRQVEEEEDDGCFVQGRCTLLLAVYQC